jgi:hypothetical protein
MAFITHIGTNLRGLEAASLYQKAAIVLVLEGDLAQRVL